MTLEFSTCKALHFKQPNWIKTKDFNYLTYFIKGASQIAEAWSNVAPFRHFLSLDPNFWYVVCKMALSNDSKRILNFGHFSVHFGHFFWLFSAFFQDFTLFLKLNGLINWSYSQQKGIFIRKSNWIKRIFNLGSFLVNFGHFFCLFLAIFQDFTHLFC